jgi:hypothetical protein
VASPTAQATKRRITDTNAEAQREAFEMFTKVRNDPELLRAGMAQSFAVRGRPMLR